MTDTDRLIRRLRRDRAKLVRTLADTPPESARVRSYERRIAEIDAALGRGVL